MNVNENIELFKKALEEGVSRRIERELEGVERTNQGGITMKALTWEEFEDLTIANLRAFHIWVQFLEFDDEEPDLFPALGEGNRVYGPCAVWCTDPNEKPLTKETYGTEWVAWAI